MEHSAPPALRYTILAAVLALAACSAPGPAHIPVSGASGPKGGAETTLYFDSEGHGHFRG